MRCWWLNAAGRKVALETQSQCKLHCFLSSLFLFCRWRGGSNKATALHGFFVLFIGAGWTGLVLAGVFVLMNNAVKSNVKYKWANVHTHARLLEDDEMRGKDLGVI